MKSKSFVSLFFLTASVWAADSPPPGPTEVPSNGSRVPIFRQFVRTLDVEGGVYAAGKQKSGAQFARIETRYLDPDVNAFVGLLGTISHFNQDLRIGKDEDLSTSPWIGNWGADVGIVRGSHLWAIDLMGASLGSHLAFGPAFVGEHRFGSHWTLFHRTTIDLFIGDTILDSDQGLIWSPWENVGFTAGYRIFTSQHMSRSGPRAGILIHFKSPKIPFLFPSLG